MTIYKNLRDYVTIHGPGANEMAIRYPLVNGANDFITRDALRGQPVLKNG